MSPFHKNVKSESLLSSWLSLIQSGSLVTPVTSTKPSTRKPAKGDYSYLLTDSKESISRIARAMALLPKAEEDERNIKGWREGSEEYRGVYYIPTTIVRV